MKKENTETKNNFSNEVAYDEKIEEEHIREYISGIEESLVRQTKVLLGERKLNTLRLIDFTKSTLSDIISYRTSSNSMELNISLVKKLSFVELEEDLIYNKKNCFFRFISYLAEKLLCRYFELYRMEEILERFQTNNEIKCNEIKCKQCGEKMNSFLYFPEEYSIDEVGNVISYSSERVEEYECPHCGMVFEIEDDYPNRVDLEGDLLKIYNLDAIIDVKTSINEHLVAIFICDEYSQEAKEQIKEIVGFVPDVSGSIITYRLCAMCNRRIADVGNICGWCEKIKQESIDDYSNDLKEKHEEER